MALPVSRIRDELADREAIRDCLVRYCRAVDRIDLALLKTVYWDDAYDDHVLFSGPISGFYDWVIPTMQAMDQSAHMIGNMLIELNGTKANVETYVFGFHRMPKEGGGWFDLLVGGRYLDTMEKRGDEWRIANRVCMVDWYREEPNSADWSRASEGHRRAQGKRFPDDRSYKLFGLFIERAIAAVR